jgi:hypothetical protein
LDKSFLKKPGKQFDKQMLLFKNSWTPLIKRQDVQVVAEVLQV